MVGRRAIWPGHRRGNSLHYLRAVGADAPMWRDQVPTLAEPVQASRWRLRLFELAATEFLGSETPAGENRKEGPTRDLLMHLLSGFNGNRACSSPRIFDGRAQDEHRNTTCETGAGANSPLIRDMSLANPLWGAPGFTENSSSSASTSAKPQSPSTWQGIGDLHPKAGRRSSATTPMGLRRLTYLWFRQSHSACCMAC